MRSNKRKSVDTSKTNIMEPSKFNKKKQKYPIPIPPSPPKRSRKKANNQQVNDVKTKTIQTPTPSPRSSQTTSKPPTKLSSLDDISATIAAVAASGSSSPPFSTASSSVQTIHVTPQNHQLLRNIQAQISRLLSLPKRNETEESALQELMVLQQQVISTGIPIPIPNPTDSNKLAQNAKNAAKKTTKTHPASTFSPSSYHVENSSRRTCNHCGLTFPRPSALESHREEIHGMEFKCEFCPAGYKFWMGQGLREHLAKMHPKEKIVHPLNGKRKTKTKEESPKKIWKCDICLKDYAKKIYLKKHLIAVHQVVESVESILPKSGDGGRARPRDHDGVGVPFSICYPANLDVLGSGVPNPNVSNGPKSVLVELELKPDPIDLEVLQCQWQNAETMGFEITPVPVPVPVKSESSELDEEREMGESIFLSLMKSETPIEDEGVIKSEFMDESYSLHSMSQKSAYL